MSGRMVIQYVTKDIGPAYSVERVDGDDLDRRWATLKQKIAKRAPVAPAEESEMKQPLFKSEDAARLEAVAAELRAQRSRAEKREAPVTKQAPVAPRVREFMPGGDGWEDVEPTAVARFLGRMTESDHEVEEYAPDDIAAPTFSDPWLREGMRPTRMAIRGSGYLVREVEVDEQGRDFRPTRAVRKDAGDDPWERAVPPGRLQRVVKGERPARWADALLGPMSNSNFFGS